MLTDMMTESGGSSARSATAPSGFECFARARVPPLEAELEQYVHRPTGARHLHIDLPAEDSAFLMSFLTPAPDSSGLTHVLEHLVMCGSERYPCRRAFFAMLGRTLSTTMNALTTEDCTAFHFATRNLADFENLLSVYLDAAFFPRLDPLDFAQEGSRVEIEAAGEEGEAPVRRGVVLSEMRGLMNEPEHQLQQALNRCLFPATPYRFDAGGDPREIPNLEHGVLKAYHRRHYHPGNAVFLSAGPVRPEWVQARLEELAVARVPSRETPAAVPVPCVDMPPLRMPARSEVRYPVLRGDDRPPAGASVALGWRLGDTADPVAAARAQLLARCLLEQGDAPLRRVLLDAPGGAGVTLASSGVQAIRRRLVFQCGVHGCDSDTAAQVESRVLAAVDDIARNGLDPARWEGALVQMERELRERHDPRYPFPLKLLTRILPAAMYGGDPVAVLDAAPVLETLRAEIRTREDVAEIARSLLRDNPERASVVAVPDPAAARRLDAEDRARLAREYGPSCRQAREQVMDRSCALRRRQESRAGESSLPRLDFDAIGPPRERPKLVEVHAGQPSRAVRGSDEDAETATTDGAAAPRVWVTRGPTGGLVYARLAVDLSGIAPDRLDDIALLCEILPESGHGGFTPAQTRARIARVCDRLSMEPMLLARAAPGSDAAGTAAPRAVLVLSARGRSCDEAALLEVLADARADPRFDRGARTAAANARTRRSGELSRHGHLHAERVAAAGIDPWSALSERWLGPGALGILDRAAGRDGDGESLEGRLCRLHRALAAAPCELQMVRDRDGGPDHDSGGVGRMRVAGSSPEAADASTSSRNSPTAPEMERREEPFSRGAARDVPDPGAWILNGPVNYCARVFPVVSADHPDAGPLSVLAAFLGGDLLQRSVRERGGAYGAGARYCDRTATVRVFSYRDPRLSGTLRDFDEAIETMRRRPPEGDRLEEAILRAVREIDRPMAFQVAARERFLDELQGRGAEGSWPLRASVLRTDPERMRDVAERYLCPEAGCTGVLAGTGREGELDGLGITWRRL